MIDLLIDNYIETRGISKYQLLQGSWRAKYWTKPILAKNAVLFVYKLNMLVSISDITMIDEGLISLESQNQVFDYNGRVQLQNIGGIIQLCCDIVNVHHTQIKLIESATPAYDKIYSGVIEYIILKPLQ